MNTFKDLIQDLVKYDQLDDEVLELAIRHCSEILFDKKSKKHHSWPYGIKIRSGDLDFAIDNVMMSKTVYDNLKSAHVGDLSIKKGGWKDAMKKHAYLEHLTPVNQTHEDILANNNTLEENLKWCLVAYIDKEKEAKQKLDNHIFTKDDIENLYKIFPKLEKLFPKINAIGFIGKSAKKSGIAPLRISYLISQNVKFYKFNSGKEMNNDEIYQYLIQNC